MTENFVFYDTETTGTNTAFDQILQFAAIHTDSDFKEIDRIEIRCRLLPHIVPAPIAMVVTGVSAQQLYDASLPSHYDMVRIIRDKLLSWSPAIFIGHNTLDFDEHLLRQALFQTLHSAYLTNSHDNQRADTLHIIQAVSVFAPKALVFPTNEKGRKIFKLDRIAPQNGFDHSHAHDATGDVEATIYLCRLIKERAKDIWDMAMYFSKKSNVFDYCRKEDVFSLTEFYYNKPHSWLVTHMGSNPDDQNELFLYDLSVDPTLLEDLTDDQLIKRLLESPKPIRRIRANNCPLLMAADKTPALSATDLTVCRQRALLLKENHALCERLMKGYLSIKTAYEKSQHTEEQIYDGFPQQDDQKRMEMFHKLPWEERLALVEQLDDQRLKTFGLRLIYFERPDLLDGKKQLEFAKFIASRIAIKNETPWLNLPTAINEIDALLATAEGEKAILLQGHRDYLVEQLGRMLPLTIE